MKKKNCLIIATLFLVSFNVLFVATADADDINSQIQTENGQEENQTNDGWVRISNQWYFFKNNVIVKGWQEYKNNMYYLDATDGHMLKGWQRIDGNWYYLDTTEDAIEGHMLKGWQQYNGNMYYLDNTDGHMLKGWKRIDGNWYYLDTTEDAIEGHMLKGWQQYNGNMYYLDPTDGHMLKGWKRIDGNWYYLNTTEDATEGHMLKGWQQYNGNWYYLDATDGHMLKGWQQYNNNWYYLDNTEDATEGHMLTGWQKVNGNLYYLYPNSGIMASDTVIDGKYLGKDGSCSSKNQSLIEYAKKYLGVKYVWGGTTPNGFDCSGFVQYVYRNAVGIELPRTTYDQRYKGVSVSYSNLQVGDLVFTSNYNHVGIYVGDGKMIHSPTEGEVVKIGPIYGFVEGRRIL